MTHVIYGVYSVGVGLACIGQTSDPIRRLRDLPIGESHHLANTIAPEMWERVIVLAWPDLLGRTTADERAVLDEVIKKPKERGLPLEHGLQITLQPPMNLRTRGANGQWRRRPLARSRSIGATIAPLIPILVCRAREAWSDLATAAAHPLDPTIATTEFGHCIFPRSIGSTGHT